MDPNGDITDAFDDEDLKRSIEASEKGPWNDEQARFRDPRLEEIERQLKEPQTKGYRERRMAELQARGIRERRKQAEAEGRTAARQPRPKPAPNNTSFGEPATFSETGQWGEPATFSENPTPTRPKPPAQPRQQAPWNRDDTPPAPPAAGDWPRKSAASSDWPEEPAAFREPGTPPTFERPASAAPTTEPVPAAAEIAAAEGEPIRAPADSSLLIAYAPSIFASTLVFVAATLVHGSLEGWHQDLVYRAVIAMIVTGILWRRFQSGRLRATSIAVTTYLTAFVTSDRLDQPESQVALFLGLLVVVAGSGLIGVQRDEFAEQTL